MGGPWKIGPSEKQVYAAIALMIVGVLTIGTLAVVAVLRVVGVL